MLARSIARSVCHVRQRAPLSAQFGLECRRSPLLSGSDPNASGPYWCPQGIAWFDCNRIAPSVCPPQHRTLSMHGIPSWTSEVWISFDRAGRVRNAVWHAPAPPGLRRRTSSGRIAFVAVEGRQRMVRPGRPARWRNPELESAPVGFRLARVRRVGNRPAHAARDPRASGSSAPLSCTSAASRQLRQYASSPRRASFQQRFARSIFHVYCGRRVPQLPARALSRRRRRRLAAVDGDAISGKKATPDCKWRRRGNTQTLLWQRHRHRLRPGLPAPFCCSPGCRGPVTSRAPFAPRRRHSSYPGDRRRSGSYVRPESGVIRPLGLRPAPATARRGAYRDPELLASRDATDLARRLRHRPRAGCPWHHPSAPGPGGQGSRGPAHAGHGTDLQRPQPANPFNNVPITAGHQRPTEPPIRRPTVRRSLR